MRFIKGLNVRCHDSLARRMQSTIQPLSRVDLLDHVLKEPRLEILQPHLNPTCGCTLGSGSSVPSQSSPLVMGIRSDRQL
jgi:hypothetical protein